MAQLVPFHRSTKVFVFGSGNVVVSEFPTATHHVVPAHDTPCRRLAIVEPVRLGLVITDQLDPFQRSIRVRLAPPPV